MQTIQKIVRTDTDNTPKTDYNAELKQALDAEYWYAGEAALSVFEEYEEGKSIFKSLEQLSLENDHYATVSVYRGTSVVTGEEAYLVRVGNQNTLYADEETVRENHSRLRDPMKVTELAFVEGYKREWTAWALEKLGLSADDLDPDIGTTEVGHSPPSGDRDVEEVLSQREQVRETEANDEDSHGLPNLDSPRSCWECGQEYTRSEIQSKRDAEWISSVNGHCYCGC